MFLHLEKIIFYLFIFCLPFQARKILYQWPARLVSQSVAGGGDGFNEWTSAYFYFTDLLLVFILLFWAWRVQKQGRSLKLRPWFFNSRIFYHNDKTVSSAKDVILKTVLVSSSFWLIVFLIISFISLIQASNLQLGFYAWLKLLEMAGLFFYLKYNFKKLFSFKKLAYVFIAGGLCQSVIAFIQYIYQKSLGLGILTESPLSPEIAGVAKIVVNGVKMIRPYGTLPHPNILAAFLLISLFLICFLWLRKKHSFISHLFLLISYFSLLLVLGLTFSRLISAVFVLASLLFFVWAFFKKPRIRQRTAGLLILFIVFSSLLSVLLWPEFSSRWAISSTEQSFSLRSFYNQTAFFIIKDHPALGIGLGNFVWEIRQMIDLLAGWAHQPVHNVYLLIASETGLIGLFVFLFFLYNLLRRFVKNKTFNIRHICILCLVSGSLLIAVFDHFFWTLQQGQLMLWLVLGIMGANCPHSLTDTRHKLRM
jgi:O-antigen ligase